MSDAREQSPGSDGSPAATELSARLTAVERALTDSETAVVDLEDAAALTSRLDRVDETVEELESRVEELEAATQALRGFLGGVRAVNRDVEQRANAALAKVESLQEQTDLRGLRVEQLDGLDVPNRTEIRDEPREDGEAGDEIGAYGGDGGCDDADGGADDRDVASRSERGVKSLAARLRDAL